MAPLKAYRDKRDFRRTPEPNRDSSDDLDHPLFVIQEHDASSHHFDFRLEVDGVLKSWAVPKGPSTDPREKRLAIRTEDHPLAYADFEGVIPEGEYGAGTVLVWDLGAYENVTRKDDENDGDIRSMTDALKEGHVLVRLSGKKIRGGYALQKFRSTDNGEHWLLVKMDDDDADARRKPVSTEPQSVISGRTLAEIVHDAQDD